MNKFLFHLRNLLSNLPGLGPRSSTLLSLQLFKHRDSLMKPLAKAISEAAEVVTACSVCGNLDSANPCQICSDGNRNTSTICVVKEVGDVWALERSGVYRGYYHAVSYTHLTLPTNRECRSRWSPYH